MSGRTAAVAALAMVVLAAVPMLRGAYAPRQLETCADPAALLSPSRLDPRSQPKEGERWSRSERNAQARVGQLPGPKRGSPSRHFEIRRAWHLPLQFQNPTLLLPNKPEPEKIELESLDVDGVELPVYYATQGVGSYAKLVAYLFVHDDEPVASPFLARIRAAPRSLVHGGTPITSFIIAEMIPNHELDAARERSTEWIIDAWRHYRSACGV